MTGVAEVPIATPDAAVEAVTYIELTRVEDWSGTAPVTLTLREGGGPLDEERWLSSAVSMRVGEVIGVLFGDAQPGANAGFSGTGPRLVWNDRGDGRYANEYQGPDASFTTDELGYLVRLAYDAFPDVDHPYPLLCAYRIPWELCPEETLVPEDAEMFFEPPVCTPPTEDDGEEPEESPVDQEREPDVGG
jgi:hypothetical protein